MSTTTLTNGRATTASPWASSSATPTAYGGGGGSSSSFVGNTPSAVLFFIALAVGAFIAALFVFFTVRYFVRARFGIHIYSIAQRNIFTGTSYGPPPDYHTDAELQAQLAYIRDNHFLRNEAIDRRLLHRRRRRRNRYSKMKKLSEQEVETLFPKKAYHAWLNGGKEHDHRIRDGAIREEALDEDPKQVAVVATASRSATHSGDEIELKDLCTPVPSHAESGDEASLHFTSGSCAICLEVIGDDDIVRGLVCGHVFHADCLDPWLTKRRACCPMCKRDYFVKDTQGDAEAADNTNDAGAERTGTSSAEAGADTGAGAADDANDANDDDSIDFEAFRNDATLRAFLQELIPPEERVRMILNDDTLQHLHLEDQARETTKRRCSNAFKIVFWNVMGISRQDLFNYAVLSLHHDFRVHEARQRAAAAPQPSTTNDTTTSAAASRRGSSAQAEQPALQAHSFRIDIPAETDVSDMSLGRHAADNRV